MSIRRPGTFLRLNGNTRNSSAIVGGEKFDWAICRDGQHEDRWRVFVPGSKRNIDLDRGLTNVCIKSLSHSRVLNG